MSAVSLYESIYKDDTELYLLVCSYIIDYSITINLH